MGSSNFCLKQLDKTAGGIDCRGRAWLQLSLRGPPGALGPDGINELLLALEQAQRLGLLVPNADGQEASFAFAHNLVRQTLPATISGPRCRLLHSRAAEALAQAHTATESKPVVVMAQEVRQAAPWRRTASWGVT